MTKGGEVDPMASSDEVEHLRGKNEDLTNLLASLNDLVVEELERKGAEIVNRRVLRNTLTEDQVVHNVKNNLAKLIEVQGIEQAKSSRDHHNVVTGMNSVIDAQVAEIDALKTEVAEIDALKTELEATKLKLKTSETMEADLGALISENNARENTAAGKKDLVQKAARIVKGELTGMKEILMKEKEMVTLYRADNCDDWDDPTVSLNSTLTTSPLTRALFDELFDTTEQTFMPINS